MSASEPKHSSWSLPPIAEAAVRPANATASIAPILRAVALGGAAQLGAKVLDLALNVVAGLAIIRYLGPSGYGDYVFVFSFAILVGLLSDFGITKVAAREMARDAAAAPAVLGTAIAARVGLAGAAWLLAQLILLALNTRPQVRTAVAIASVLFITDALRSVVVVFQVKLAMQYDALVGLFDQAVNTAIVLWMISRGVGLLALVAAPALSGLAALVLAIVIARGRFQLRLQLDWRRVPALLGESLPVGLALLMAAAYLKLDSVLLALLRSPREVGLYGAAYRPVEYLLVASTVIMTTLFPLLARWYRTDHRRFRLVYQRGAEILLALGIPIAVVAALMASPILTALYAPAFVAAALPFQLLTLALVLMMLNGWQAFALLAGGRQRVALAYDAAALALNIVLNLILIVAFGYIGAALAALSTAVFITICSTVAVTRCVGATPDIRRVSRLVLANAAVALSIWGLTWLAAPWWSVLPLVGSSYPAWLLLFRVTSLNELRMLLPRASIAGAAAWGA
jgi:O-antigen/teichoic acid export membrane protein